MVMIVAKQASFDAAHYLPNYEGKCRNLHGHHWVVELAVRGPLQGGMVVDFKWLKDALEGICGKLDHSLLNDILPEPTAENIVNYICDRFTGEWIQGPGERVQLAWIKVWETEDSYAMLEG